MRILAKLECVMTRPTLQFGARTIVTNTPHSETNRRLVVVRVGLGLSKLPVATVNLPVLWAQRKEPFHKFGITS